MRDRGCLKTHYHIGGKATIIVNIDNKSSLYFWIESLSMNVLYYSIEKSLKLGMLTTHIYLLLAGRMLGFLDQLSTYRS